MMDEYNQKQQKKQELEQAGANTVHTAGKAAATYFGGRIGNIAYDKISQTKLGQKIENGAGKVISKIPGVNKINKGLNDTGIVDAAGKATDLAAGKVGSLKEPLNKGLKPTGNRRPNQGGSPTGSNKSAPKLKNNNSRNRGGIKSLAPKALQKNKQTQGLKNRFSNFLSGKEETNEAAATDNTSYEDETPSLINGKTTIMLKLLPIILPIIIVIIIIVVIIAAIITPLSMIASFFGFGDYKEDSTTISETITEEKKRENEYYEAIIGSNDGSVKGIIAEYQEKYGVTLDWVLLHAIISYRFSTSTDDIYSSEGSDDISDEDFEDFDENFEGNDENSTDDNSDATSSIDYSEAKKKIKAVADLMVINENGYYSTDSVVDGKVYNKLIESSFLKDYYKDFLANDDYETRKKLVDNIYDYAELAREYLNIEDKVLTTPLGEGLVVNLQTCETPYTKTKNERNKTVYNNPNVNEGTNYPKYLEIKDYLKGVILGEIEGYMKEDTKEAVKAMVVAATTFLLGSDYVDFYPGVEEIGFPNGNCRQASCDPNYGCSHGITGGSSTIYTGLDRTESNINIKGWKKPLSAEKQAFMDEILEEIFGEVMVHKGVTTASFKGSADFSTAQFRASCSYSGCLSQNGAAEDARNGMTYKEILAKYYDDSKFDIINIREGLYVENADYQDAEYNGNVIFYDQNDYKQSFCGRSTTISASGCGVTSAAIVISSFTGNRQYDPVYMSNFAKTTQDCGPGISGTNASFFKKVAERFNYGYEFIRKNNASRVIEILKQGNAMVIAHMGPGHFTNGGHYIVLTGVNDKGQVYVHDPNNRRNKINHNSGNGWYDFNSIIVKETKSESGFYAIIKR